MNFENPEPLSFVTPKGEFRYSWFVEPDTKFEKCEYKVEVLVPAEQGMAKIIDDLEAHLGGNGRKPARHRIPTKRGSWWTRSRGPLPMTLATLA